MSTTLFEDLTLAILYGMAFLVLIMFAGYVVKHSERISFTILEILIKLDDLIRSVLRKIMES